MSVAVPLRQSAARGLKLALIETPSTRPLLPMAMAELYASPGTGSEVGDAALLPKKTMKACVPRGVRGSHNLPVIVQAGSVDPGKPPVSTKVAQVDRVAVPPQNRMKRREIVLLKRIERSAISAGAHSLAEIVDRECNAVRIAINGRELLDAHRRPRERFHPDDRLELDGLRRNGRPGQVESTSPFSAVPATMPKSLISSATPLLPSVPALLRSLGSATMAPFCHRKGTQVLPLWVRPSAVDPQKSSPFGSGVSVSACPAACPRRFTPKATLFGPSESGMLMTFALVPSHSTACDTHSAGLLGLARTASPLTNPCR